VAGIKKVKLTKEGLEALENEFEYLKTVKRKEVSEKIKVALSFGDLSENSEYDEAKNEQAMVEARINELDAILKDVHIVDEGDISTDVVSLGTTVTLKNLKNGKVDSYKIVGSTEAAPMKKKISDESPVGKAVIGHKAGEVVDAEVPSGIIQYEILEITK
jgi:transcription elongation factor GreA